MFRAILIDNLPQAPLRVVRNFHSMGAAEVWAKRELRAIRALFGTSVHARVLIKRVNH